MDQDEWLNKYTIYCESFGARISTAQCKINRKKAHNGEGAYKTCIRCSVPDETVEENTVECDICEEEYPISCFDKDENDEIIKQCCYCQQKYFLGKYAEED